MGDSIPCSRLGGKCLCKICKCGEHKCPQVVKISEEKTPKYEDNGIKQIPPHPFRYSTTTHKHDYNPIPENVIRQTRVGFAEDHSSLKNDGQSYEKESVSKRDFVPWPVTSSEMKAYMKELADNLNEEYIEDYDTRVWLNLRKYYCPPHCIGDQKLSKPRNCVSSHKAQFNIGAQPKKHSTNISIEPEPMSKFSNYRLDFKRPEMEPKASKKIISTSSPPNGTPMERSTYRSDYDVASTPATTSKRSSMKSKEINKTSTTNNKTYIQGDPMSKHSSHMMDYRAHSPSKTKSYKPPECNVVSKGAPMDDETTERASYLKWEKLPEQKTSKRSKEANIHFAETQDTRHLVSVYQEDYDDLSAALCPAKKIQDHGRQCLEPRYTFVGRDQGHECYKTSDQSY